MVSLYPGSDLHPGQTLYQDEVDLGGPVMRNAPGSSGTLYRVAVFNAVTALRRRISASWNHPPVATVQWMEKFHHPKPYEQVCPTASNGWILVGGLPGAGHEAYYLFRTINGGQTWSLEQYTSYAAGCRPRARSCFPVGGVGYIDMGFWSPHVGVIVDANHEVPKAIVIRTQDGGKTWSLTKTLPLATPATEATSSTTMAPSPCR